MPSRSPHRDRSASASATCSAAVEIVRAFLSAGPPLPCKGGVPELAFLRGRAPRAETRPRSDCPPEVPSLKRPIWLWLGVCALVVSSPAGAETAAPLYKRADAPIP